MATQPQPNPQPAPPPVTPPARPADNPAAGTEDARFLAFAKENIGLLAGVASVPMLSSASGALKPPQGMDQLTVLSSLLCIVVFAACFTMRGVLGAAAKSRHLLMKAVPGVVSLLLVAGAIYLIATFSTMQKQTENAALLTAATRALPAAVPAGATGATAPTGTTGASGATAASAATSPSGSSAATGPAGTTGTSGAAGAAPPALAKTPTKATTPDAAATTTQAPAVAAPVPDNLRTQVILFLSIYPTLIFALALILVTNFTQQTARDIQTVIEQKLPEQAKSLFDRLTLIGQFYDLGRNRGQEEFLKIGEELIADRNEILKNLSVGIIELGGAEAIRMQQVLVQTFKKSFDAVSCCDLNFWVNAANDSMSRDYFRLNLEALKRSSNVTRLLILSDEEVSRTASVVKAIEQHEKFGIGWAVVPYMDLDPSTREEDEDLALDFGLYDDSKVAIYFRDYQNNTRKLRAVFPGPDRQNFIARQRQRYADLVSQCWLVSSAFLARLEKLPAEDLTKLKRAALKNALVTARQLSLDDRVQVFQPLVDRDPATLALKDCFLFPNCDNEVEVCAKRMYELRRASLDWTGPRASSTAAAS